MINSRGFESPKDIESISNFLDKIYSIEPNQNNWQTARWQYAAYFINPLNQMRGNDFFNQSIRIWEDDGEIVAFICCEDPEDAFIQIHPAYTHLLTEIFIWAETNLSYTDEFDKKAITIWSNDLDLSKTILLSQQGYVKYSSFEFLRYFHLKDYIPDRPQLDDYKILSLLEYTNLESKCAVTVKAFGSSGLPIELYRSMQSAPLYRPDLDLVIVDKNDEAVACGTFWFNPHIQTGYIEPMATHPAYQGIGLGKAILTEGLSRLKNLGTNIVYVGSYGEKVGQFYASAGFHAYERHTPWTKSLE